MGHGSYNALGTLSVFVFLGLVAYGINAGESHRTAVFVGSVFLVLLGAPLLFYSLYTIQKYKKVFDFEPATFWGRQRTGKYIREVMMTMIWISFWSVLTGIFLLVLMK